MTKKQEKQLNQLLIKYTALSKEKYLFGMVAAMIKNSIERVLKGENTLQELKAALIATKPNEKGQPLAYDHFKKALNEVALIIVGGEIDL